MNGSATPDSGDQAAPSWSQTGLRWIARLCAITATVLFALVLVAIHRERLIHQSANELVATLHIDNGYFDDRVDYASLGRIRDETQDLRQTLTQLDSAAAEDVRLLQLIVPEVTRLLEAGRTDLDIAHDLPGVADTLHTNAQHILRIAGHADGTVASADARLATTVDLVTRLNRALGNIDARLRIISAVPLPPATNGAPALPELFQAGGSR
jgi:hypothetical protein